MEVGAVLASPGFLWHILLRLIQDASFRATYCIIDAVDECEDGSTRWLASQFAELHEETAKGRMHVLIVSREVPELSSVKRIHLSSKAAGHVGSDVETFTSVKMRTLARRLHLSKGFSTRIQAELLRRAEGIFLWIGHAMAELYTLNTSVEIEDAVSELPTGLPAIYSRMLLKISPARRQICVTILHWVTIASEPMTMEELCAAIAFHVRQSEPPGQQQTFRDYVKLCEPPLAI